MRAALGLHNRPMPACLLRTPALLGRRLMLLAAVALLAGPAGAASRRSCRVGLEVYLFSRYDGGFSKRTLPSGRVTLTGPL